MSGTLRRRHPATTSWHPARLGRTHSERDEAQWNDDCNINHVKIDRNLRPLKLALEATAISLINNGHAIEEESESPNTLTLNGEVYTSAQFHFQTLSEHAIGGQRHGTPRRVQNPAGKTAVVGTLFRIAAELIGNCVERQLTPVRVLNSVTGFVALAGGATQRDPR